jgi:epoxyqueuosine reductase
LIPQLENLILNDQSELVRGAAVWAIQQLGSKNNLDKIKSKHLSIELNNSVIEEWIV